MGMRQPESVRPSPLLALAPGAAAQQQRQVSRLQQVRFCRRAPAGGWWLVSVFGLSHSQHLFNLLVTGPHVVVWLGVFHLHGTEQFALQAAGADKRQGSLCTCRSDWCSSAWMCGMPASRAANAAMTCIGQGGGQRRIGFCNSPRQPAHRGSLHPSSLAGIPQQSKVEGPPWAPVEGQHLSHLATQCDGLLVVLLPVEHAALAAGAGRGSHVGRAGGQLCLPCPYN